MRGIMASALLCVLLGCRSGDTAEPAQPEPVAPSAQKAAAAAPAREATPVERKEPRPVVDEPTFRLALEAKPGYAPGQGGTFDLTLEGRGGYHINQEYPTRIKVQAAQPLGVDKTELAKADAAEFGEQKARFEIAFAGAPAGQHKVTCDVDFAVCTAETCVPERRTVAALINVR